MDQAARLATFNLDYETVITRFTRQVEPLGMRVIRSFDFRSACASYPNLVCPHHGTSPCDCQMVVLLVYRGKVSPASVVIHSQRGNTKVDLVDHPNNRPGKELVEAIRLVLNAMGVSECQTPRCRPQNAKKP